MNIFLINPPYYFRGGIEYLTQNLGLGYIAACLLADGHRVEALDALAEGMDRVERVMVTGRWVNRIGLSYEEITRRVPAAIDLIGITAPFSNHATIIDGLCHAIKDRFPDTPIVLGGVYPSTQPERAMKSAADFVVVGEGEGSMVALASGKDPSDIPGVWLLRDGMVVDGGKSEPILNLDSIPFPARNLFPMDKYLTLSPRSRPGLPTATIITSRGCPFDCTFCSIHPVYGKKWRARSGGNVLAEVDYLIDKWGVKYIEFEDDNLTLDPRRARAIFEGLADRSVHWSCANGFRVDSLDRELIELMRRSGCEAIHLAIESGDPDMLEAMNKKLNLDKVEEVVAVCHDLNIPTVTFFMIGHPGETERRFKKSMRVVHRLKKRGMVACGAHIATPYPGTRLFQYCKEKGYLVYDDAEERIMFPGDVHIVTEDFSRRDILARVYGMRLATGMVPDLTSGLEGFYRWKIRPILSKIGLSKRKYAANIPDRKLDGFYHAEKWFDGITYRWSSGYALVNVIVPKNAKGIKLLLKSNREHEIKVLLGFTPLGEISLQERWTEYFLSLPEKHPVGKTRLCFQSDAVSPHDLGYNEITRAQGFILSWYEFQLTGSRLHTLD